MRRHELSAALAVASIWWWWLNCQTWYVGVSRFGIVLVRKIIVNQFSLRSQASLAGHYGWVAKKGSGSAKQDMRSEACIGCVDKQSSHDAVVATITLLVSAAFTFLF